MKPSRTTSLKDSRMSLSIRTIASGATENFMNLSYTKWLKLPIINLEKPQKLFNVNRTENKAGVLKLLGTHYFMGSKT